MKKASILIIILLFAAVLMGCQQQSNQTQANPVTAPATTTTSSQVSTSTPDIQANDTKTPAEVADNSGSVKTDDEHKLTFVIKTDKGDIKGELYPKVAPNTVLNFVTLAKKGFYKNLTFHRVVPGFVIQGGDPKGDGSGGPGYSIPAEFNKTHHGLGALAMARAQHPDSAGCQFYVCIADCGQLDGQYTVFGQVTEGMPTALQIEVGDKIKDVIIKGDLPADIKGKEIKKSNIKEQ